MKRKTLFTRLTSLFLALVLAVSLAPAALAAGSMGNFKKVRDYPGFSDVPADKWYADDVRQAYELDLINGKGNGKFDPEGNLTLAEAITMGVRVHAIYFGKSFTPGGSPWYDNAVRYAVAEGIIQEGSYTDYGALATRADLANLFFSLPVQEFQRINRIAWIPDVTPDMSYCDFIYLLYGAGVLTGSATGEFQPGNLVTRAEAAAIINRVVLPENRVHTSVTTNAPGEVVTGANGNFKISIPADQGWEVSQNDLDEAGWCSFVCAKADVSGEPVGLVLMAAAKNSLPSITLSDFFDAVLETEIEDGAQVMDNSVSYSQARGWSCHYVRYTDSDQIDWEIFCMENSTQFYCIKLATLEDFSQAMYTELLEVFYTLDIAL
ncbi:MAG: S-layer homology domain-containing protein [Oscillospiraceae bacterium]|nr:S-layer homology domain-containing protein [Oscillospiraceae bacterium]